MTDINDLVLIYFEGTPVFYARVENITPDVKPDWFHIKLLLLQIPLQTVSWILRDAYINGDEFTMGGKKIRIEKVISPDDEENDMDDDFNENNDEEINEKSSTGKVISLADMKKKNNIKPPR